MAEEQPGGPPPAKRPKTVHIREPNSSKYTSWNSSEVHSFFSLRGIKKIKDIFGKIHDSADVKGSDLDLLAARDQFCLDDDDELCKASAEAEHLVKSLQQLQYMVYQDPIHGPIELHPLIATIIDTPEFQRLRRIMQLGGGCYIFSGATHTRFEHSIGVCYIAGELTQHLKRKQPELEIEEKDILCVQIAGLCHDLGHGPFSHMFESYFMKELQSGDKWKHEEISAKIFRQLYQRMSAHFEKYGLGETDCKFIEEQIEGCDHSRMDFEGRPRKRFLYEIVANRRNGIDVDKWDYFARDCHSMGLSNDFQWRRAMLMSRVIKGESNSASSSQPTSSQKHEDSWQICMRDKEVENIYNLFHTRNTLRRKAYYHKTKSIVERMIAEALLKVKDVPIIPIRSGERSQAHTRVSITEAVENALKADPDMTGFLSLTDDIVQQILDFQFPALSAQDMMDSVMESQALLKRVLERKLYKYIGVVPVKKSSRILKVATKELEQEISGEDEDSKSTCHVEVVKFSHGSEEKHLNPVNDVYFYSKANPWKPIPIPDTKVSPLVIPKEFSEIEMRVYYKGDGSSSDLNLAFSLWAETNMEDLGLIQLDEPLDNGSPYFSPYAREKKQSNGGSGNAEGKLSPRPITF